MVKTQSLMATYLVVAKAQYPSRRTEQWDPPSPVNTRRPSLCSGVTPDLSHWETLIGYLIIYQMARICALGYQGDCMCQCQGTEPIQAPWTLLSIQPDIIGSGCFSRKGKESSKKCGQALPTSAGRVDHLSSGHLRHLRITGAISPLRHVRRLCSCPMLQTYRLTSQYPDVNRAICCGYILSIKEGAVKTAVMSWIQHSPISIENAT